MDEEWSDVDGFPEWMISNQGRVLNNWTGRTMALRQNQSGIVMVGLTRDGRQVTRSVPLMVANAFLEPPVNEFHTSVIHLDGDKTNCFVENLMWKPRWYAVRYHNQFKKEPMDVSVYLTDTDETFETIREACVKYGLIEQDVYNDLWNQRGVGYMGYIFKRALD